MTSNKWYSTAGQIFGESRGWRVQEIKRVQVSAIHCKTETLHNRKTHQSQVVNDYLLLLHWCFLFCLTFDYKLISSLSITETGAHVGTINQKNVMWRLLRLRRSQILHAPPAFTALPLSSGVRIPSVSLCYTQVAVVNQNKPGQAQPSLTLAMLARNVIMCTLRCFNKHNAVCFATFSWQ